MKIKYRIVYVGDNDYDIQIKVVKFFFFGKWKFWSNDISLESAIEKVNKYIEEDKETENKPKKNQVVWKN